QKVAPRRGPGDRLHLQGMHREQKRSRYRAAAALGKIAQEKENEASVEKMENEACRVKRHGAKRRVPVKETTVIEKDKAVSQAATVNVEKEEGQQGKRQSLSVHTQFQQEGRVISSSAPVAVH